MRRILGALAALVATTTSLPAQSPFWQRAETPLAGAVESIASDSLGNLFAMTRDGIHRSTDDGTSWSRATGTPPDATFRDFAVGRAGGELFAAALDSGIYRSTDAGATWSRTGEWKDMPWALDIAVDIEREILVATTEGVLRSSDAGATWSVAGARRSIQALALAADGSALIASGDSVLLSRRGARDTWTPVFVITRNADRVNALAFTHAGTMLAGFINSTIRRSTDGGREWEDVSGDFQLGAVYWFSVAPDGSVLAMTTIGELIRSTDDGLTWRVLARMPTSFTRIHQSRTGRIFTHAFVGIDASDDSGTTWRPSDAGINTAEIRSILETSTGTVIALQNIGPVHRSNDGGRTWDPSDSLRLVDGSGVLPGIHMALDSVRNRIFVTSRIGELLRSTNGGEQWEAFRDMPTPIETVSALPGGRVAVTSGEQILITTDGGETWAGGTALPPGFTIVASAAIDGTYFVASAIGVHRSVDGGAFESVLQESAYSLAVGDDGALYAGGDGKLFRSTDRGVTWTTALTTVRSFVYRLAVGPRGEIVAGMRHGGVYISTDDGASFTHHVDGMSSTQIGALAFVRGRLIAGTFGGGIYRGGGVSSVAIMQRVFQMMLY